MSRRSQSVKTGKALRNLNNFDNVSKRTERADACCNGCKQPSGEYRPRSMNNDLDDMGEESKENVRTVKKISEIVRTKGKLQRHSTKKQLTTRRNMSSVSSASSCSSSSRSLLSESSTSTSSLSSSSSFSSSSTSCDYYSSDGDINEDDINESDEDITETDDDDDSYCRCNRK